jgi:hypothetical protein
LIENLENNYKKDGRMPGRDALGDLGFLDPFSSPSFPPHGFGLVGNLGSTIPSSGDLGTGLSDAIILENNISSLSLGMDNRSCSQGTY